MMDVSKKKKKVKMIFGVNNHIKTFVLYLK